MATLEQQRRASGAALEAGRRANGTALETSRRAGGDAMVERRTGKSVVDDINSLAIPPTPRRTLRKIDPIGPLPSQRGSGVYKAPTATGGGIASPLTEKTKPEQVNGQVIQVADREYYPPKTISSPDGLITLRINPLKTLSMTDANGAEVTFEFAQT